MPIVYYLFILPISLLPFPILYALSDGLYVIMYYVIGYRKKVVMENLKNSFPEKTHAERVAIAKKFYHHFCDLTLESLKMFSVSEKDALDRMKYLDTEVAEKFYQQGRSIIVAMAHFNNWEMVAITIPFAMKHQTYAIYKPLTNAYMDRKMLASREKYGLKMMHNRTVKEDFQRMKDQLTATFFLIDQAPSVHSKPHWMTFLNQETGVLTGTELYAKLYNYPVVFLDVQKTGRGRYTCRFVEITDSPRAQPDFEILEKTTRILEKSIQEKPEFWLWSHRRWKRKRA